MKGKVNNAKDEKLRIDFLVTKELTDKPVSQLTDKKLIPSLVAYIADSLLHQWVISSEFNIE